MAGLADRHFMETFNSNYLEYYVTLDILYAIFTSSDIITLNSDIMIANWQVKEGFFF